MGSRLKALLPSLGQAMGLGLLPIAFPLLSPGLRGYHWAPVQGGSKVGPEEEFKGDPRLYPTPTLHKRGKGGEQAGKLPASNTIKELISSSGSGSLGQHGE